MSSEEVEEVRSQLERVMDRVYELVKRFPPAKNNYALLVLLYWMEYDGLKYRKTRTGFTIDIPYAKIGKLTPPETITRAFRKLVELGKVKPDERIRKIRKIKEEAFRKATVSL